MQREMHGDEVLGMWNGGCASQEMRCYLLDVTVVSRNVLVVGWLWSVQLRKSQTKMVSSWELLTIWKSSNCRRNTRPVCS